MRIRLFVYGSVVTGFVAAVGAPGAGKVERTIASETKNGAPAPKTDQRTLAEVQKCLEEKRRKNWELRQQKEKEAKEQSGAGAYTFRKVNGSELPSSNFTGSLADFKQALNYQLVACGLIPEKKVADEIAVECKDNPKTSFCGSPADRRNELDARRLARAPKYNETTTSKFGCREVTRADWCTNSNRRMLELAEQSSDIPSLFSKIREKFDWYRSDGALADDPRNMAFKKGDVQFTAYFVPSPIEARLEPSGAFRFPIYRRPNSIVPANSKAGVDCGEDSLTHQARAWCMKTLDGRYLPAPERKAIDLENALKDPSLVIAYVKDRYDVANLMLQGSGSISVPGPDGPKIIRLNFDGTNGRTRYMLSNVIECDGGSPEDWSSIKAIGEYLANHSDRKEALMALDTSYVFYRPTTDKPMGSAGVPVTARHSLATDNEVLPKGLISWFHINKTEADKARKKAACPDLSSIAIAQDSGGAIHGTHVDYYMGEGEEAKESANSFNCPGSLFVAIPKGAGRPLAQCKE